MYKNLGIIGAGAWGTALAMSGTRAGLKAQIWAFEKDVVDSINNAHQNSLYLPNTTLPDNLTASTDIISVAKHSDVLLLTVPTQFMAKTLEPLVGHLPTNTPLIICSKGVEIGTGRLISQIVQGLFPDNPVGILTGPSFAGEVAQDLPTALTLAMPDIYQDLALKLCAALSHQHMRLYASDDVIAAQVGGAIKNVIAVACGIAEGKQMGCNARAAIITRGLAEIARLTRALGGDPTALMGLAGLGDLTLTCNAMQSRNFSLGVAVGQGQKVSQILAERTSVAEGYYTAKATVELADKLDVDMPICKGVFDTLYHEKAIEHVIKNLLERPVQKEVA